MLHPENDPEYKGLTVNSGVAPVSIVNPYFAAANRRVPLPIAEKAAGLLHNRFERRGVPNLKIRVDHNVRFSGRDEVIPVSVPPSAGQPNFAFDLVVGAVAS